MGVGGISMTTKATKDTRKLYMNQYDEELVTICNKLNPAYIVYSDCKERFRKILDYYRVQLHRGYITKEQYHERATMFIGYNEKRGYKHVPK